MCCVCLREFFSLVFFGIEIRISMKCFVWFLLFGSSISFCLQRVLNSSQFALFIFQWESLLSWRHCGILTMIEKWLLLQRLLLTFHLLSHVAWGDCIVLCLDLSKCLWIDWNMLVIYCLGWKVIVVAYFLEDFAFFIGFLAPPYSVRTIKVT